MKLSLSAARSITLAIVAALITAGSVNAALFLVLAPESGPSGTEVAGRTGGEGAFASSVVGPLQTYFVDQADADGVSSPDDPALVDIGQLMIDTNGNGSIRFVVPDLAPGGYVVMVHCPQCAEFNAGRIMLGVASFDVRWKRRTRLLQQSADASQEALLGRGFLFEFRRVFGLERGAVEARIVGIPHAARPRVERAGVEVWWGRGGVESHRALL